MHQLDFENKLADISKGRIVIEDSQIEHRDKEEDNIYKANWKGFEIYAKMGKNDWVKTPILFQQTGMYLKIKPFMKITINLWKV